MKELMVLLLIFVALGILGCVQENPQNQQPANPETGNTPEAPVAQETGNIPDAPATPVLDSTQETENASQDVPGTDDSLNADNAEIYSDVENISDELNGIDPEEIQETAIVPISSNDLEVD